MQTSFSIGTRENIELLRSKLDTEFAILEDSGVKVNFSQNPLGDLIFLGYNIDNGVNSSYTDEETNVIFRHYIANAVSDLILNNWEKSLLLDIIKQNFYYFSPDEQQVIYSIALKSLNHGFVNDSEAFSQYLNRKALVLQKLLEYLHTNDKLIVEGFIRFRLKDYMHELYLVVDRAVDDYMLDKEYREFIKLLKYFVEIQEPKLDTVQVMVQNSGQFRLLNEEGDNISTEYLDGVALEVDNEDISFEDILISALITIAPRKIIVHVVKFENNRAIETIKNVFGERVVHCDGCRLCFEQLDN